MLRRCVDAMQSVPVNEQSEARPLRSVLPLGALGNAELEQLSATTANEPMLDENGHLHYIPDHQNPYLLELEQRRAPKDPAPTRTPAARSRVRARSSLTGGRPRTTRRTARSHAPPGDDDPGPEPDIDGEPGKVPGHPLAPPCEKEALMRRHRPPRRRRADHRQPRPVDPGFAVGVLLELLGSCWECGAPVERTPSGLCAISHGPGCRLAADVGRAA
jgi:hypothetical protein